MFHPLCLKKFDCAFLASIVCLLGAIACSVDVVPPPDDCAANPAFVLWVEANVQDGVTTDWTSYVRL